MPRKHALHHIKVDQDTGRVLDIQSTFQSADAERPSKTASKKDRQALSRWVTRLCKLSEKQLTLLGLPEPLLLQATRIRLMQVGDARARETKNLISAFSELNQKDPDLMPRCREALKDLGLKF